MLVRCIKGLPKATYRPRNAFCKNRRYQVSKEEEFIIWVIDELGHPFSFAKSRKKAPKELYLFEEFFRRVTR